MKLSFRTVFWGSAALIVIVLLVLAFRPRPVPVDMGEVMSGPMSVTVSDEGRTRIRDVYAVAAPVGGRLLRVAAEAGDAVAAGDVVARLLPSEPAFLDARTEAEARARPPHRRTLRHRRRAPRLCCTVPPPHRHRPRSCVRAWPCMTDLLG